MGLKREDDQEPEDGAFTGLGVGWSDFFEALSANQTKAWFDANRHVYEHEVLQPLRKLLAALSFAFEVRDLPLIGDPKRSIFRLNRDVRFSKDKRPYKTNAGAVLTRDGTKSSPGLLYIHLDPADPFVALGFYMPEPDQLTALRDAIAAAPDGWRKLEKTLARAELVLGRDGALTRLPKGYDPEKVAAVADAIRLKSFVVRRSLPVQKVLGADLVDDIVAFALAGRPLLEFGWSALAKARRDP